MLSHLFKLVWNRKRANTLIVIELTAAFFVLFLVCLAVIHFSRVTRQPLGYEYHNVWHLSASRNDDLAPIDKATRMQQVRQIVSTLKSLSEVESVSFATTTPFGPGQTNRTLEEDEPNSRIEISTVDDNYATTMKLRLTQGRWFNVSDDMYSGTTSTVKPVVINEAAVQKLFGKDNPIGKDIAYTKNRPNTPAMASAPKNAGQMRIVRVSRLERRGDNTQYRVVGVIDDYRRGSEFEQTAPFMFFRFSMNDTTGWLPQSILVRMKSGVTASYEEHLVKTLKANAADWTFQISTLETDRAKKHEVFFVPFGIGLTVAGFMLLTVGLGLVGVVWQSVTRRMRELGVRRAFGATQQDIYLFVIGELIALTTFAIIFGVIVIAQIPLLPFYDVPQSTYFLSICAAIVGIYVLTTVCALYPSRLAGTVQPSDALRYE